MQGPLSVPDIKEAKALEEAKQRKYLLGVVWGDGRVTTHVVPPPEKAGDENGPTTGHTVVNWINGGPRIRKPFEDQGCRFLKDVCAADGVPELYEVWRQTVAEAKAGSRILATDADIYPPTVLKLRRDHARGVGSNGKVFVPGRGHVDADELEAEAEAPAASEPARPTASKKASSNG